MIFDDLDMYAKGYKNYGWFVEWDDWYDDQYVFLVAFNVIKDFKQLLLDLQIISKASQTIF